MVQKKQSIAELRSRGVVKLREDEMFSLWVKTACCNLNSNQLRKLAEITEKYARSYLLFTTRQIPIIPFVNQKDVEKVTEELNTIYLELDRCGPTVRNVNVCYDDKICPYALANSLSLGEKLDNFFRASMSHKVKIGVAGCEKDCVIARVLSDIGFVAVERKGRKGYDADVGGRLGLNPFVGIKIAQSLSEDECVRLVQNYFDFMTKEGKPGERAADLIERLGEEKVRQELTRELKANTGLASVKCETRLNENQVDKTVLRIRATCGEVKVLRVAEVNLPELGSIDLLIVGSPTQGGRPTPAIQDFLNKVSAFIKGVNVAAFDTRLSTRWVGIFGYAAGRIAGNLKGKGGTLIASPEAFFVKSKEGPLKDGELERAASWAKEIAK